MQVVAWDFEGSATSFLVSGNLLLCVRLFCRLCVHIISATYPHVFCHILCVPDFFSQLFIQLQQSTKILISHLFFNPCFRISSATSVSTFVQSTVHSIIHSTKYTTLPSTRHSSFHSTIIIPPSTIPHLVYHILACPC